MKDELQVETYYLKAKSIIQRIKDISYTASQLEEKYPQRTLDSNRKKWMLHTYLAYKEDLQEILNNLEKLHDDYKNREEKE